MNSIQYIKSKLRKKDIYYICPDNSEFGIYPLSVLIFRYIYKIKGKPVGIIDLLQDSIDYDACAICYAVIPKYRRKGIGQKLLNIAVLSGHFLGYNHIYYLVNKKNKASIKSAKKFGLKFKWKDNDDLCYDYVGG